MVQELEAKSLGVPRDHLEVTLRELLSLSQSVFTAVAAPAPAPPDTVAMARSLGSAVAVAVWRQL